MIGRELLNAQKELTAHNFSQAQAYSNVILLAGYGGFFAVWSFMKPEFTKLEVFLSGFLIALSLVAFMVWEIYACFYRSRSNISLSKAVTKAVKNPSDFHQLLSQHNDAEHTRIIRFGRVWAIFFGFSIVTGFSAIFIILWAFMKGLWRLYWH